MSNVAVASSLLRPHRGVRRGVGVESGHKGNVSAAESGKSARMSSQPRTFDALVEFPEW